MADTETDEDVRALINQFDAMIDRFGVPFVLSRLAKRYGPAEVKGIAAALLWEKAGRHPSFDDTIALHRMAMLIHRDGIGPWVAAGQMVEGGLVGGKNPQRRLYAKYRAQQRKDFEMLHKSSNTT